MAQVYSLFNTFEEAEKAVRMLTERGYAADTIRLLRQGSSGTPRQIEGEAVAPQEDKDDLLSQVARQLPKLTGFLGGAIPSGARAHLDTALSEAGVPAERSADYTSAIEDGGVLVSVTTEDFRAEDVRNILDDASGHYMNRLLAEDLAADLADSEDEAGGGGKMSRSAFE